METDIQELEEGLSALDQYDREMRAREEDSLRKLEESLDPLARELDRLDIAHQTQLKAAKGRFNVFTVLRGSGEETGLHSAWLAYLLNPKAEHDCGSLFLDMFVETLKEKGVELHDGTRDELQKINNFNGDKAEVKSEFWFKHGRIDILISSPGSVIAIENKIWAYEQPDQISRYIKYLTSMNVKGEKIVLYLTPEGKKSATAGKLEDRYRRISYRGHILPWLDECLRETYQYVNINQALQQYKNALCKILDGHSQLEEIFMTKIEDIIRKHPSIIGHWTDIKSAVDRLRCNCLGDFLLNRLPTELDNLDSTKSGSTKSGRFKARRFRDFNKNEIQTVIFTDDQNLLLSDDPKKDNFVFAIEWVKETNSLIYGTILGRDPAPDEQAKLKKLSDMLGYSYPPPEYNGFWLSGYRTCSDDFMTDKWLFGILAEDNCLKEAQRIAKVIYDYLEIVKKWADALSQAPSAGQVNDTVLR